MIDALSVKGHDLAGNLIVGETSYQTFLRLFRSGIDPGPRREAAAPLYGFFVDQILQEPAQSSVGGARPKFALRLADGSGLIVKFTPPLSTAAGQRWADLLRMEAHASSVLRSAGLESVHCRYLELDNRGYLEIERFDRVAGGGRVGHVTLFHLGAACYSEVADPATVVQNLVRDGHLRPDDEHCFRRIHEFSGAIGNDDTHQGNYGLLIDDAGLARLAPAYDVVPMAFAPRHDELPDRFVKGMNQQRGRETAKLVSQLVEEVRADPGITPAFRDAWTECVAEPA